MRASRVRCPSVDISGPIGIEHKRARPCYCGSCGEVPGASGIFNYLSTSRLSDRYNTAYPERQCSKPDILAHLRGRLRRRAEGGAGSGVRRRRLVTAVPREARDPARQALRPGCEELAALIRRKCRRRKRGPRPKIATVERREASVPPPWDAPRQARHVVRRNARQQKYCAFRRSARPSWGGWKREKQNLGAETRRGNEEDCAV